MNATLNYIIEANLGLIILMGFYYLFLRKETGFTLMRIYLLVSILVSLTLPVIDFDYTQDALPLSIGRVIPSYWLPEVAINDTRAEKPFEAAFGFWRYTAAIYIAGLILCCSIVIIEVIRLMRIFRQSRIYHVDNLRIAESTEDKATFSFFRFVFIGKAHELTVAEKEQIIRHESVHSRQWHSFDILLINILGVFFWFNPIIRTYKKIFIQLHEFEADARTVENSDVNKYCSLLARVALQSADFKLANHFNNSLTVKRIEMMRKIKSNIKHWKLAALSTALPMVFFVVSCQDQVGDDMMAITKNSSHALIVPEYVQQRFEQVKKENPGKQYALVEMNETASGKLESLKEQYGLPKSIEVISTINGKPVEEAVKGYGGDITIAERRTSSASGPASNIKIRETRPRKDGEQTFAIIEFTDEVRKLSESASQDDKVFTVVEHMPEFPGGYDALLTFIRGNLRYPAEARKQGIEGTVYVAFIVEEDGSISSPNVVRGISPQCDEEVLRVVKSFPDWSPGEQGGKKVKVRFVLPIKFGLG